MATLILKSIPKLSLLTGPTQAEIYLNHVEISSIPDLHCDYVDQNFSDDIVLIDESFFTNEKIWSKSPIVEEIYKLNFATCVTALVRKKIFQYNPFRDLFLVRLNSNLFIHIEPITEE